MTSSSSTLDDLQTEAVDAIRRYAHETGEAATACLKVVASTIVAAREHFYTKDGGPDWLGSTGAYRTWLRETVSAANVERSEVTTLLNAVRYHTGNALRERLDAETLTSLGLRPISPRARSVEKRQGTSHLLTLFSGGPKITDAADLAEAVRAMELAVRRFDLSGLDRTEKTRVRAALGRVNDVIAATLAGKALPPRA